MSTVASLNDDYLIPYIYLALTVYIGYKYMRFQNWSPQESSVLEEKDRMDRIGNS